MHFSKPGSACFPFFGVVPVTLDPETGKELEGACEGRHVDVTYIRSFIFLAVEYHIRLFVEAVLLQ